MKTNQAIESAIQHVAEINKNGYNLDALAEFITQEDYPHSIAKRILEANFQFIELLTANNESPGMYSNAFFIFRLLYNVFNTMEDCKNEGVISLRVENNETTPNDYDTLKNEYEYLQRRFEDQKRLSDTKQQLYEVTKSRLDDCLAQLSAQNNQ